MSTPYRARLVDKRKTVFVPTDDASYAWRVAHAVYPILPGCVGFWPMSGVGRDIVEGVVYTILTNNSGQSHSLHDLFYYPSSRTGMVGYAGLVPYVRFFGANGYGRIGDLVLYSITGTESYIVPARRGLTFGAWVQFSDTSTAVGVMGKDDGLDYSFYLERTSGNYIRMVVFSGATASSVTNAIEVDDQGWYLIIGRWTPSTDLCLFVNGVKTRQAGGPASLYDPNAALYVGGATRTASGTAERWISMAFICSMSLSDTLCQNVWHQTRAMFGR